MTDAVNLALLRGSAEHLYDFCAKQQDESPLGNCLYCPLYFACLQVRRLNYTSLEDLMGIILYSIQQHQKTVKEGVE